MAELTEREKKLALVKYIVHGVSPFSEADLNTRINMLKAACKFHGFEYDDAELQEIGRACLDFQQTTNELCLKFLGSNTELYKVAMKQIKKGNDPITALLKKDNIDKALSKVRGMLKVDF